MMLQGVTLDMALATVLGIGGARQSFKTTSRTETERLFGEWQSTLWSLCTYADDF